MKKYLSLTFLIGVAIFFSSYISPDMQNSINNLSLKHNGFKKNAENKLIYISFEFDYGGCHYTEDLFINDDHSGGTGFITRSCGKGGSTTMRFTIHALHYARVESINDIEWTDQLPSEINTTTFLDTFINYTNQALSQNL